MFFIQTQNWSASLGVLQERWVCLCPGSPPGVLKTERILATMRARIEKAETDSKEVTSDEVQLRSQHAGALDMCLQILGDRSFYQVLLMSCHLLAPLRAEYGATNKRNRNAEESRAYFVSMSAGRGYESLQACLGQLQDRHAWEKATLTDADDLTSDSGVVVEQQALNKMHRTIQEVIVCLSLTNLKECFLHNHPRPAQKLHVGTSRIGVPLLGPGWTDVQACVPVVGTALQISQLA